MPINNETKEIAALALRNAFWLDFSGMVNRYLAVAKGLDVTALEVQMDELSNVYGRDKNVDGDFEPDIWSGHEGGLCYHGSVCEALTDPHALMVYIRGHKVFERGNTKDEWSGIEDKEEKEA